MPAGQGIYANWRGFLRVILVMEQLCVAPDRHVLFLCTGNYYRSRYAEIIFSILAEKQRLSWTAASRGLQTAMGGCNIGPISPLALAALTGHGICLPLPIRRPLQATAADFQSASIVIGMDESEHRAMIVQEFSPYAHRVEYWHIHDLDRSGPEAALTEVEVNVRALVARIVQLGR